MTKIPKKLKKGQRLTAEHMNTLRAAIIELQRKLKRRAT